MERTQQNFTYKQSPIAGLIGLFLIFGFIYILFKMVSGVWAILSIIAPILFVIAAIMNFKVIKDFGKMIVNTFKENKLRGLLYGVGTFFGFPLVSAFLFLKAFSLRRIDKMKKKVYSEYEDVTEEDEDFLELPEMEAQTQSASKKNDYEDLFEE
jgi:hypothetical protein